MSKIPQGEWNAIAARYAHGESITKIAQTYGCTPPAIHYILKRSRQRTASNIQQPLKPEPQALSTFTSEPETSRPVAPPAEWRRAAQSPEGESGRASVPPVELRPSTGRQIAPGQPMVNGRSQPAATQPTAGNPRSAGRTSAFTAGLDSELHGRAEAAIAAFRSSFTAALAEGSPQLRQQLRQAASDLMRVAARTTIVLDRLNARAEGAARPAGEQPRSGHARY